MAPATSDVYAMYQFRKYCHPFDSSSYPSKNTIAILSKGSPGAIRYKTIADFLNYSFESVEKTGDIIPGAKKNQPTKQTNKQKQIISFSS